MCNKLIDNIASQICNTMCNKLIDNIASQIYREG